jgi:hypothetical protein
MLTDSQRLLISAAVDGLLDDGAWVEFRQLLAASSDALTLYQTLQIHSARLAALPRQQLPASHAAALAAAWSALPTPRPLTTVARRSVRDSRRWVTLAVAASALIVVTVVSFRSARIDVRSHPRPVTEVAAIPPVMPRVENTDPVGLPPAPLEFVPAPDEVALAVPGILVTPETAPLPRAAVEKSLIGSGQFGPGLGFDSVDVRLPTVTTAASLGDLPLEEFVSTDAKESTLVRLDLFSADTVAGVALVRDAARVAKIAVVADALTQERLRQKLPLAWAFQADSLTPAQAKGWLAAIAAEARGATTPPVSAVHAAPAGASDRRDARDLFGVSHEKSPPTKSIESKTIGEVSGALTHPTAEVALTTFAPKSLRMSVTLSPELRGYAERHTGARRGSVSLLIVVRPRE